MFLQLQFYISLPVLSTFSVFSAFKTDLEAEEEELIVLVLASELSLPRPTTFTFTQA